MRVGSTCRDMQCQSLAGTSHEDGEIAEARLDKSVLVCRNDELNMILLHPQKLDWMTSVSTLNDTRLYLVTATNLVHARTTTPSQKTRDRT